MIETDTANRPRKPRGRAIKGRGPVKSSTPTVGRYRGRGRKKKLVQRPKTRVRGKPRGPVTRPTQAALLLQRLGWRVSEFARRLGCNYRAGLAWHAGRDRHGKRTPCPLPVIKWLRKCARAVERVKVAFT